MCSYLSVILNDMCLQHHLFIYIVVQVHRLIIVDKNNKLDGVVSLSDILNYLVKEDRHLSDSFSGVSCSG